MAKHDIPDDKATWSRFDVMDEDIMRDLKSIQMSVHLVFFFSRKRVRRR